MLSSSCTQSVFFQCLPASPLCWGGGRTSKAVWWRDQKPHLVTRGGVMCWWYWCQRGKVFHCLSTILIPTHSSRNFQSLLFSIVKGARNSFLLQFPPVQNSLPLGEHPWRINIRRVLSAEQWCLPAPEQSCACSVETLWERRQKDVSLPGDFHGGASVEGNKRMAWIGSCCLAAGRFPLPVWVW